ncbi:MAG: OprO/OprP family phosphate-selective porin [Pirellula sp.]
MSASKLFAGLALASLVCSTATAQVQSSFGSQDPSESVAREPESTRSRLDELEAHAAENDSKIKSLEASAAAAKSKLPSVQLGGVFQADGVAFEQDQASRATYGRIESGADFRRARLGAKGSITDSMDYFMQMDFAFFGRPTFTDLWVDFKEAGPLGTVRVGQWKQPFSLESVSSFRYTTFMERAGVFQAFVPFRHVGVGLYDHSKDERWTWASSYLRTGQDQFGGSLSTDQGNGLASRLTHLAWSNQEGDNYMHLGLGYYLNAPSNGRYRSRSIPEIYVGEYVSPPGEPNGTSGQPVGTIANGTPFMVDTGLLSDVSLVNTYGTEQLWVLGPISLQSELMAQHIDSAALSNGLLWGGYSQVGYFLTGEHRPYDRKSGTIDRVKPISSVSKSGGIGAWEIALRWSYLDLLDRQIRGGEMENITAGLNWYVNPNCKCVFNYIHCDALARASKNGILLSDPLTASTTHAFGLRCQVDF